MWGNYRPEPWIVRTLRPSQRIPPGLCVHDYVNGACSAGDGCTWEHKTKTAKKKDASWKEVKWGEALRKQLEGRQKE